MTTTPVTSITDEQLAELEDYCAIPVFRDDVDAQLVMGELRGLIARLRAAEADAKRYRRFRHNTSVNRGMSHAEVDEEFDTAMQFVEEAMERKA